MNPEYTIKFTINDNSINLHFVDALGEIHSIISFQSWESCLDYLNHYRSSIFYIVQPPVTSSSSLKTRFT